MNQAMFDLPAHNQAGSTDHSSNAKPVVLAFNKYFLPGFRSGGPTRTLANMSDRLGGEFSFFIVTQDRDAGDSAAYDNIDTKSWNVVRLAKVRYLARGAVTLRTLRALIREVAPDVIYLNSFFDPIFTQRILMLRWLWRMSDIPVVLAPRGEFSSAALGIKSVRKKAYLFLSRKAGFYRNLIWQASSEYERADIRRTLPFVPESAIRVVTNLSPLARAIEEPKRIRQQYEPLRVCFLSRISPMKNLDYALSCLSHVKGEITFTIFGPREDAKYWTVCEEIMRSLPSNVSVIYKGEVEHHQVPGALAQHDLFFLPTRGENYGHVIYEALAAGLPVLISDTTSWGGIAERRAGWVLPLDQETAYTRIIDDVATWPPEKFATMKYNALAFAAECAEDANVLRANRQLFNEAMA